MLATPTWHLPLPSAWGPCTTRHTAIYVGCDERCRAFVCHGLHAATSFESRLQAVGCVVLDLLRKRNCVNRSLERLSEQQQQHGGGCDERRRE